MRRRTSTCRTAILEPLEERFCLASSLGWDGPGRGGAALTYYIANAPSSLSQAVVNAALKTALDAWSSVANITFTQTTQANRIDSIDFSFLPIDGVGGTLAQSYYPDDVNPASIAGDVQLDSSEQWEVGNALGRAAVDLVLTAVHEIGHSLGLDHSSVAGSVMAPAISSDQSFTGLAPADVNSILSLYAPANTATTTTTTTNTTTTTPSTTPTTVDDTPDPAPPPRFRHPRAWRHRWFQRRGGQLA